MTLPGYRITAVCVGTDAAAEMTEVWVMPLAASANAAMQHAQFSIWPRVHAAVCDPDVILYADPSVAYEVLASLCNSVAPDQLSINVRDVPL